MTLILIIAIIWGTSAIARAAKEAARQKEIDRQRREQAARSAELARLTAEWKQRQAEAERRYSEQQKIAQMVREDRQRRAEETAARIALEAEQMRQRREQEKLFAEQAKERKEREAADAKLAKEQEKLAKRVEALEYKMRQLDRNIEAQNELLADYYAQLDWLLLQQSGTVSGGSEFAKWQNKIVTKNNQIRKAECKLADMNDAKERAAKEIAA